MTVNHIPICHYRGGFGHVGPTPDGAPGGCQLWLSENLFTDPDPPPRVFTVWSGCIKLRSVPIPLYTP